MNAADILQLPADDVGLLPKWTRRMLERKPWQQGDGFLDGIVVHEED